MITKDEAIARIIEMQGRFARACESAPDVMWHTRPSAGHWSPADVCEHVTISHGNLHKVLSKRVLETRVAPGEADVADDEIPYVFYRGEEPPDIAAPTGRWPRKGEGVEAFRASVTPIVDWARGATADLRGHGAKHFAFGTLDGVQWLLFVAAHMERHRAQLLGLQRQ